MLLSVLAIYALIGFGLFFVGITNIFQLPRGTRITLMAVNLIILIFVIFNSFSIDSPVCNFTAAIITCTTNTTVEYTMAIINLAFFIITLIYLIMEAFGAMPTENSGKGLEGA